MKELNFDKRIYDISAIKSTAACFKDLAKFSISQKENYIIVKIDDAEQEFGDVIAGEFANYVLALMIRDLK